MSLYIDLTDFLATPMKTGIQRICGEMCKYLPLSVAIPVRLHLGRYLALPPKLIGLIAKYFQGQGDSGIAEINRVVTTEEGVAVDISTSDTVLIPEIFGEQRAEFFGRLTEEQLKRCRFIIYDLLPLTHPEYFVWDMPLLTAGYYHTVRRACRCGFISAYTRDTYYQRLKRTDLQDGVVLPLGSDSLGPRPKKLSLNRPLTFSVLGTIEPRKNQEMILDAFEPLLCQVEGLTLSFIGKMGWVKPEFAQRVMALAADEKSGLRFHSVQGDDAIRKYLEQSRATIYVSSAEGYGLPPVESLWAGTPVIASKMVPSLADLASSAGINFVEPLNVLNLRRAVLAFIDDEYANQKVEETQRLNLPTWRSFTEEVLRWCTEVSTD